MTITSRDRVIFPDSGQTKGDLADYYTAIAPIMLPFMANRPVSLVRCPQGTTKGCFFQKHDNGSFGPDVKHVPIREKEGGVGDYLFLKDAAGLLACVQMGTVEFHVWGASCEDVEVPDRLVFDLDPGDGLQFADVVRAAKDIRDKLAETELVSFAMVTGGKGVHVLVPLRPGHSWEEHKCFARRLGEELSRAQPDRFTSKISKAARKGRSFIDYLRNQRGNTAIAPYSVRARAGAPVAAPVDWDELDDYDSSRPFTIGDAERLLERAKSPALAMYGLADQALPKG